METRKFKTRKDFFKFLVENKESLIEAKKSTIKEKGLFNLNVSVQPSVTKLKAEKSDVNSQEEIEEEILLVTAVINTTKIFDSHFDVHLDGIWDKFLENNSSRIRVKHVQEHKSREFNKIISSGEDLITSVKSVTWKSLGFDFPGKTQALTFESKVRKSRNPYMYQQYKNGWVDNHSVGMWYEKLDIAIDDEDYPANKDLYDKYIGQVVNSEEIEKHGYFWVVFEAGIKEGSAVPDGSNFATPTTSIIDMNNKQEIVVIENKEETVEDEQTEEQKLIEDRNKTILSWLKS